MGMNATVVLMLDNLHTIKDDPNFGEKLLAAVRRQTMTNAPEDVRGSTATAIVVEQHHADHMAIVAVGCNDGLVLSRCAGSYTASPKEMLESLAEQYGYRLVKKSEPKGKGPEEGSVP